MEDEDEFTFSLEIYVHSLIYLPFPPPLKNPTISCNFLDFPLLVIFPKYKTAHISPLINPIYVFESGDSFVFNMDPQRLFSLLLDNKFTIMIVDHMMESNDKKPTLDQIKILATNSINVRSCFEQSYKGFKNGGQQNGVLEDEFSVFDLLSNEVGCVKLTIRSLCMMKNNLKKPFTTPKNPTLHNTSNNEPKKPQSPSKFTPLLTSPKPFYLVQTPSSNAPKKLAFKSPKQLNFSLEKEKDEAIVTPPIITIQSNTKTPKKPTSPTKKTPPPKLQRERQISSPPKTTPTKKPSPKTTPTKKSEPKTRTSPRKSPPIKSGKIEIEQPKQETFDQKKLEESVYLEKIQNMNGTEKELNNEITELENLANDLLKILHERKELPERKIPFKDDTELKSIVAKIASKLESDPFILTKSNEGSVDIVGDALKTQSSLDENFLALGVSDILSNTFPTITDDQSQDNLGKSGGFENSFDFGLESEVSNYDDLSENFTDTLHSFNTASTTTTNDEEVEEN